eukprot:TRINITY_DN1465_c2_g1_i1.p1 TRINITY_DN1465_c2_g1~~TRINITY_DN1465_c2_g1_i1.p1  ORF type:complete len:629 (+),score=320.59 TRINITY_DN1465_c2_g1_i1:169-2055(+)
MSTKPKISNPKKATGKKTYPKAANTKQKQNKEKEIKVEKRLNATLEETFCLRPGGGLLSNFGTAKSISEEASANAANINENIEKGSSEVKSDKPITQETIKQKRTYSIEQLKQLQKSATSAPSEMDWYLKEFGNLLFQQINNQPNQNYQQQRYHVNDKQQQQQQQQQYKEGYQKRNQQSNEQNKKNENVWVPANLDIFATADPREQKLRRVVAHVKSILNRITTENFELLGNQIIEEFISETIPEIKTAIVQQLFLKAIKEPSFSEMYAKLSEELNKNGSTWLIKLENDESKNADARQAIVAFCRDHFVKTVKKNGSFIQRSEAERSAQIITPEDIEKELLINKQKQLSVGNIRYLCELYNRKMVSSKVILECVHLILSKSQPAEEDIELLFTLFKTSGQKLARDQEKYMSIYIKYTQHLIGLNIFPPRFRFMLQNIPDFITITNKVNEISTPNNNNSTSTSTTATTTTSASIGGGVTWNEDSIESEVQKTFKQLFKETSPTGIITNIKRVSNFNSIATKFIDNLLFETIDKKSSQQELVFDLIKQLFIEQLLKSENLIEAFNSIISILEDITIDSPKAPEIIGSFIAICSKNNWFGSSTNTFPTTLSIADISKEFSSRVKSSFQSNL